MHRLLSLAFLLLVIANSRGADTPVILTPPSPATPEIHGAKVFGVRPGHPFLFTIAATGRRPMSFSADGLPAGLSLDAGTGRITGTAPGAGDYAVMLHARNALGETQRAFLIKAGNAIALTPPMGWNSWNCFAGAVAEKDIRAAADAMVKSGLAQHGWTYVNVDDFWQENPGQGRNDPTLSGPERNADGSIHPNARFPDMKGMADYIHSLGLKAGLYSSPGPYTCGGCVGSYQHEDQDAQTYAEWGFDYLKYDWCTYNRVYQKEDGGQGLAGLQKPYQVMATSLARASRDIVFSFCQYGMGDVWKWGAQAGGNSWRTTGDIRDTWESMMSNAERGANLSAYAGPGHWNDPDMLVVGKVGWGPHLHATHLTPDEQYTHISLWCLQGAPLLIGCDLTQLDPFTLGLLTNDEVIDIDQDPLGQVATRVRVQNEFPPAPDPARQAGYEVWTRPLEGGDIAVALINTSSRSLSATVMWPELGIVGRHMVRDVWRQSNLGPYADKFTAWNVPAHGVVLVRIGEASL